MTKPGSHRIRRLTPGHKLFFMTVPFIAVTFAFAYLPLSGWSYAFFDYRAGMSLLDCDFVGLKHFLTPVQNAVLRRDVLRVMQNTFGISLLGLLFSPLPMFFAIFLTEIRTGWFKKTVQTLSTIPNFISWVLVYSVVWSMFAVNDGLINRLLLSLGRIEHGINFLASPDHIWIKMVGYGIWKGLGWSAILYIASIAGIDSELYEAARIDGANRYRLIRHITVPCLMPTFFVLLVISIANFLNNGMDQYFVFQNAMNKARIEVLDLYVYNQGMTGNQISYSTAVGMLKSLVSVVLLFLANRLSRIVRGHSVI